MTVSDSQFIQEATQCLYSDLNIEKSLYSVFSYMKDFFPLDMAHMFIYDVTRDTLRYLALATDQRGYLIDETIPISGEGKVEVRKFKVNSVYCYPTSSGGLMREVISHLTKNTRNPMVEDGEIFSTIGLVLDIGMSLGGGLSLMARGTDRYSDEHKRKLGLLSNVLSGSILNLLRHREIVSLNERLVREKDELQKRLEQDMEQEVIGKDSGLKHVTALVRYVAPTASPVMLTGETGVGKELIARMIHRESSRSTGPFISVNCGAIPETLVDTELFGHEKGAFTGALGLKRGYFEQADGGTIFLDEIGELPLQSQVRFLRVLQSMEFHRVGGQRPLSVDIRVIAATNRDLSSMVKNNQFREDLWFRLNVFPIIIPPLRDRRADIPDMTRYIAWKKARELNLETRPAISGEAMDTLLAYDWPGNIRELQNVIERALIVSNGRELIFPNLAPSAPDSGDVVALSEQDSLPTLDDMTIRLIEKALALSGGRINGRGGAAEILGVNPSTLRGKMKKYGIETVRKTEVVRIQRDP